MDLRWPLFFVLILLYYFDFSVFFSFFSFFDHVRKICLEWNLFLALSIFDLSIFIESCHYISVQVVERYAYSYTIFLLIFDFRLRKIPICAELCSFVLLVFPYYSSSRKKSLLYELLVNLNVDFVCYMPDDKVVVN